MTTCKLCKRERTLRKSHIIPEFFYKEIYDEKGRFFPRKTGKAGRQEQKGIRELLLCDECEGHLSAFEKYGREVIFGGEEIAGKRTQDAVFLSELDYPKLKVFLISILWRMSVASGPMWSLVDLGPHEEKLRKLVLNGVPGDELDIPVLCTAPLFEGELLTDLILQPDSVLGHDGHYFRAVIGGYIFSFFVSETVITWPKPLRKITLKEDGTWIILVKDAREIEFLVKDLKSIVGTTQGG